jgi:hypothetical protein
MMMKVSSGLLRAVIIYFFCPTWIGAHYFYDKKEVGERRLSLPSQASPSCPFCIQAGRVGMFVYAVGQLLPMAMTAAYLLKQRDVATFRIVAGGSDVG